MSRKGRIYYVGGKEYSSKELLSFYEAHKKVGKSISFSQFLKRIDGPYEYKDLNDLLSRKLKKGRKKLDIKENKKDLSKIIKIGIVVGLGGMLLLNIKKRK